LIYVLRYLFVAVWTVPLGLGACLTAIVDRSGESTIRIARLWVRGILRFCGIRVEAVGAEEVGPGPYVFMSNHQSVVDIAALVSTLPVSFRFVAKRELLWIPIFGWALALSDHVVVDRGNRAKSVESLQRAAERIRRGTNVIIFPEGTRSPTGELQAFKSGGFYLAMDAQVPILPVTVSGSRQITPKRSLRIESGIVKIVYGKPIPTMGLTREDHPWLKEQVRAALVAGYDRDLQGPAPPA
jgi:1-acyl-sn-glycerol-3-phosphate acyltransferase